MTEENGISRRSLLKTAAGVASAAAMVGGTMTAAHAAKLPKTAVSYQDSPHGKQSCSNCKLFMPPDACKSVAGKISPHGWCHIYLAKS